MPTARERLELSRLDLTQRELMGEDVDLEHFFLQMKGVTGIGIVDKITGASVNRTTDNSSTLTVSVDDQDGDLLNSPLLHRRCDVQIDGLWFRLCKMNGSGDTLTLTFEDREIAVLRTYNKPIKQSQATSRAAGVTRAEFIVRMLREVKEFKIPYVIPDLHKVKAFEHTDQQVAQSQKDYTRSNGVSPQDLSDLTVKGAQMTSEQAKNVNTILDVGMSMLMPHDVLIASLMCAIQESSIRNLKQGKPGDYNYLGIDPNGNPVGVFQQIKRWGWPASRDVAKDAHAFFAKAVKIYNSDRKQPLYALVERVQNSGNGRAYAAWHPEAVRIVAAYYGETTGTGQDQQALNWSANDAGQDNEYEFYRGSPEQSASGTKIWKPESSWAAIQRLADEVNKRAFFVSGTFYFISDSALMKSRPRMVLSPDHIAVQNVDFDWDLGKSEAEITLGVQMARWVAPPGSVIKMKRMGALNGRWLVSAVERDIFDHQGEITLVKAEPELPEPPTGNVDTGSNANTQWKLKNQPGGPSGGHEKFLVGPVKCIKPIPRTGHNRTGGVHQTAGLAGYPAIDDFAKPGTKVLAVESGVVTKLSGNNPMLGAVDGVGGPLGWSVYLRGKFSGTTYYYTHLDSRRVKVGDQVEMGDVIATVADYDRQGGVGFSHCHLGVHPGKLTVYDMIAAGRGIPA